MTRSLLWIAFLTSIPLLAPTLHAQALAADVTLAHAAEMAQDSKREGDQIYRPESGQAGKDVVWVPTPASLVSAMLKAAQVKPSDYVVDLGSGDGRLTIAAAKDFGARALGIEYNPDLVALAKRNAERAGVGGRAQFIEADIFKSDFSSATVVTLYLLPTLNMKLRPTLLAMAPGTRIVSHAFDMGDWEPDQRLESEGQQAFLWIVPAKVEGEWLFEIGGKSTKIRLTQNFQNIKASQLIKNGTLRGNQVTFTNIDGKQLRGMLKGDRLVGEGWQARRI